MIKRNGQVPAKFLYIGMNQDLISGESYTLRQFSESSGVSAQVIRLRSKAAPFNYVNDDLLVKTQSGKNIELFKIKVNLSISQHWLTRKLTGRA